ncbi:MAG: AI-2E family transporter [Planctomycetia bacterium]|nr:AI-2E family transporter [Planctomycetia bacterium]
MKPKPSLPDLSEKKSQLINYAVILASIIIILAGVHFAKGILAPIFMATFLAVLLLPSTHWLQAKGLSQATSLTVVILSVLFIGILTTTILGTQLTSFVQNIPIYKNKFNEELRRFNISLSDLFPSLEDTNDSDEEKSSTSSHNRHKTNFSKSNNSGYLSKEEKSLLLPFLTTPILPLSSSSSFDSENGKATAKNDNILRKNDNKIQWAEYTEKKEPSVVLTEFLTDSSGNLTGSLGNSVLEESSDIPASIQSGPASSNSENDIDPHHSFLNEYQKQYGFFESLSDQDSTGFFGQTSLDNLDSNSKNANFANSLYSLKNDNNLETNLNDENGLNDNLTLLGQETLTSENAVDASSRELFLFLKNLASELSFLASNAFIIMLLVIFMLLEGSKLPLKITAALGKRNLTNEHIRQVANDIRRYMMIKTFVSIIVGLSVTILLVVSNVQYPLLWGFIAFFLNFIPNIGSVVAAIPPIILATVDHGFWVGSIDAVFFVLINCIVGYVLEPKLLGDGLDISPLVILLSLIISGWILGPVGMFLSPPLAVIIKIILQSFPETRWIAVIMANSVPKEKEDDPNIPSEYQKIV